MCVSALRCRVLGRCCQAQGGAREVSNFLSAGRPGTWQERLEPLFCPFGGLLFQHTSALVLCQPHEPSLQMVLSAVTGPSGRKKRDHSSNGGGTLEGVPDSCSQKTAVSYAGCELYLLLAET